MDEDDPLDSRIDLSISDGCQGVAFLMLIGLGVVAAAFAIMLLQAIGVEVLR